MKLSSIFCEPPFKEPEKKEITNLQKQQKVTEILNSPESDTLEDEMCRSFVIRLNTDQSIEML